MDIIGMGTQVLECVRVRGLIERHGERFLHSVFTASEIAYCNGRKQTTEHFAALWAAKEAVLRSMGLTWQPGMSWTEVEIVAAPDGPRVVVRGALREEADKRRVGRFLLAMARCRGFATATVLALRGEEPSPPPDADA